MGEEERGGETPTPFFTKRRRGREGGMPRQPGGGDSTIFEIRPLHSAIFSFTVILNEKSILNAVTSLPLRVGSLNGDGFGRKR